MFGINHIFHTLLSFLQKQLPHQGEQGHNLRCELCSISRLLSPALLRSGQRQGAGLRRARRCSAPGQWIHHTAAAREAGLPCPECKAATLQHLPGGQTWKSARLPSGEGRVAAGNVLYLHVPSPCSAPRASCSLAAEPAPAGRAASHW